MNPIVGINVFRDKSRRGEEYSIGAAEAVLQGLAEANALAITLYNLPRLYSSGVRYVRERRGKRENWQGIQGVLRSKKADCDDLSAARVGELIATGEDPLARVYIYRTGPRTLHAVVRRGNGKIEDPSRILGMGARG